MLESIRAVARRCGVSRVVLFARVRGRATVQERHRSGGVRRRSGALRLGCRGGGADPALLDFVNMDGPVSQELKEHVAQEGVVLYEEVR
ncbi:MAG: hypothetical protein ACLSDQ_05400 [Adlercreutzia equolifaciens]